MLPSESPQNIQHFLSQNRSFHSCSLSSPVGMGDYLTAHLFSALPATRNIPSQGRRWSLGSLCREARDERSTETARRSRLPLLIPPTPCLRGRKMGGTGLIFLIFSILQTSCRNPKNPEQLKKIIRIGQSISLYIPSIYSISPVFLMHTLQSIPKCLFCT